MTDEWSPPEAEPQTGGKTYGKYTYKPLGGLTKVLVGLTALGVLLLVMGSVIEVIDTFGDYGLSRLVQGGNSPLSMLLVFMFFCVGLGLVGLSLVTIPVWCIWHYRAAANLYVLHRGEMLYRPDAQVYWWFIPFVNLVVPYKAMKELMRLADEDLNAAAMFDTGPSKIMSTMPIWWTFWLTGNISNNCSFRFSWDVDTLQLSAVLSVIGAIGSAVAAYFYISYVRFIHQSIETQAS